MILRFGWKTFIVAAALLASLGGCNSATSSNDTTRQDSSGALVQISPQPDRDITNSVLWLPAPLVASSGEFKQTLRDNESPIQSIVGDDLLLYHLQYSAGFYQFFTRSTTEDIQSETEFKSRFASALESFDGSPEKIGFQTSRTGGYIWRSEVAGLMCIAGRIGTGVGGRASVGASVGMPYNVIVKLFYCDASNEVIDEVDAFLRSPKLVSDRESFAAYVSSVKSRTN